MDIETPLQETLLQDLPADIMIYQMTFLKPKDVVNLCQTNKKIRNICVNPVYMNQWRNMIENTYGSLQEYQQYIRDHPDVVYNYGLYTQFLSLLPIDSQLDIYERINDIDSYIQVIDKMLYNVIKF